MQKVKVFTLVFSAFFAIGNLLGATALADEPSESTGYIFDIGNGERAREFSTHGGLRDLRFSIHESSRASILAIDDTISSRGIFSGEVLIPSAPYHINAPYFFYRISNCGNRHYYTTLAHIPNVSYSVGIQNSVFYQGKHISNKTSEISDLISDIINKSCEHFSLNTAFSEILQSNLTFWFTRFFDYIDLDFNQTEEVNPFAHLTFFSTANNNVIDSFYLEIFPNFN